MIGKGLNIDGYVIQEELGRGGFGSVYLAVEEGTNRMVAIKFLHPKNFRNEDVKKGFLDEMILQARLSACPNIVAVIRSVRYSDRQGEHLGMVMEYVEGEPLDMFIERNGLLPDFVAIPIMLQALNGLAFAHRQGMLHRDIKPGNIMVGNNGLVKLMDFGLAKTMESSTSGASESARAASLSYVSPERLARQKIDARTDIYSLGCTFFEALTGKPPYEIEPGDWHDAQVKHQSGQFPDIRSFYPEHSETLQNLVSLMIQPDLTKRAVSCDFLIEGMKPLLDHIGLLDQAPSLHQDLLQTTRSVLGQNDGQFSKKNTSISFPEPVFETQYSYPSSVHVQTAQQTNRTDVFINCPMCKMILPGDCRICSQCGTNIDILRKKCPSCGNQYLEGQSFCSKCGYKFPSKNKQNINEKESQAKPKSQTGNAEQKKILTGISLEQIKRHFISCAILWFLMLFEWIRNKNVFELMAKGYYVDTDLAPLYFFLFFLGSLFMIFSFSWRAREGVLGKLHLFFPIFTLSQCLAVLPVFWTVVNSSRYDATSIGVLALMHCFFMLLITIWDIVKYKNVLLIETLLLLFAVITPFEGTNAVFSLQKTYNWIIVVIFIAAIMRFVIYKAQDLNASYNVYYKISNIIVNIMSLPMFIAVISSADERGYSFAPFLWLFLTIQMPFRFVYELLHPSTRAANKTELQQMVVQAKQITQLVKKDWEIINGRIKMWTVYFVAIVVFQVYLIIIRGGYSFVFFGIVLSDSALRFLFALMNIILSVFSIYNLRKRLKWGFGIMIGWSGMLAFSSLSEGIYVFLKEPRWFVHVFFSLRFSSMLFWVFLFMQIAFLIWLSQNKKIFEQNEASSK